MSDLPAKDALHFGDRLDMNAFVVENPGVRLQHERGATLVHGYFTTPELARSLEAVSLELADAERRNPDGRVEDMPVWELYLDALHDVTSARSNVHDYASHNSDTLDIDTGWLADNATVENERLVPGQFFTAEELYMSGAADWLPARKLR